MGPFDLKAALLAKHAQHVVMIHFPIALFISTFAFDFLSLLRRSRALATVAYYNLIGAAVAALPAVATGLVAWQWLYGGRRMRGNLRLHLVLGLSSSAMIWLLCWLRTRRNRPAEQRPSAYYLALETAAVALVALTAHVGGFLSGVNAPG